MGFAISSITREDLTNMRGVVLRDGSGESGNASAHELSQRSSDPRRRRLRRAGHHQRPHRRVRHIPAIALAGLLAVALATVGISWLLGAFGSSTPRFLVPLYDESTADWSRACSGLRGTDSLTVANIGNPGGPGASPSSTWTANLRACSDDHVNVLGYVDTGYCQVPLATAEGQIDSWFHWYGAAGLRGIFLDQVSNPPDPAAQSDCLAETSSALRYYRTLASYVHAKAGGTTVVDNFGLNPLTDWALSGGSENQRADIVVTFENSSMAYASWLPAAWEASYPANNFSVLVDSASSADQPASFCAAVAKQHVGYHFASPFASWNSLPPSGYFSSEVAQCR